MLKNIEHIPTDQIEKLDRLGGGNFGEVFKGKWFINIVALKMLRNYSKEVLLSEVSVLTKLRHPNIVQFLGIWTSPQKDIFIVTGRDFLFFKNSFLQFFFFLNANRIFGQRRSFASFARRKIID